MPKVINPYPLFLDGRGALLDGGYIYVGTPNNDPEIPANQAALFWDQALTEPAAQPLRTLGGIIAHGQNPALCWLAAADYSQTIRDVNNVLVSFTPSWAETATGPAYQPLDSDLTAIAALITTSFGRNLLTLADSAALKSATGIPNCLPLTGGSVSGAIIRSGAGIHPYHANAAMTGGRIFLTAVGAADPTSQPGDIWLTY